MKSSDPRWTNVAARCAAALLLTLLLAAEAGAVRPSEWAHQTEADFQQSELSQTVVTDLGRVELSRAAEKIAEAGGESTIIYDALRGPGGELVLAMGPEGALATLGDDERIETVAEYEGEQVFALAPGDDRVWVGVSGAKSRLEARNAEMEVVRTIQLPEVRYVWDILVDGPRLWIATGAEGELHMIDLRDDEPAPVVALETGQKNILCLGIDGKGRVYAGTDTDGLVYRVERRDDEDEPFSMFVLYDAAEPEIGALLVKADGTVYAGTADAQQARPGRMTEAVSEEKGEPQADGGGEGEGDGGDGDAPGDPDEIPGNPKPDPKADGGGQGDAEPTADGGADDPPAAAEAAEAAGAEPVEPVEPAKPTAEQYDKLREVVRGRLKKIREGKQVEIGGSGGSSGLSPRRPSGASRPAAQQEVKGGNAVYRIQPNGFVQEVFRESVMILRIVELEGDLLIATGNEGQVFRVDPETQETTVIADLDPKQAPAMRLVDGEVLAGTANPAVVVRIGDQYAEEGTYAHDPMDAGQPSLWGRLAVLAELPDDTTVTVSTRSGNVADPAGGGWSKWSAPARVKPTAEGQPVYLDVESPTARFLQYRLALTSDGEATPSVSRVAVKYLVPNMRPKIAALRAGYPENGDNGEGPAAKVKLNVEWEAADDNGDTLTYKLEARRLGTDQPFVEIDDEIEGNSYEWNTLSMPEGRYELRLTASDAPDNVADEAKTARRVSAPVVVDNSSPGIADLEVKAGAKSGTAAVKADIKDALSPIVEVRYKLNSEDEWKAVLPTDRIYDSTSESVSFTISGLPAGRHVIGLRAVDALGNARYAAETVEVAKQ